MKKPDFIGVGFPKCGTSFFYDVLMEHPDVIHNQLSKEIHYFSKAMSTYDESDGEAYRAIFPNVLGKITGEYSPGTLYYPGSIAKTKKATPDSKIIVMIRNPIDRCLSHFKHMKKNRVKNISAKNETLLINNSIFPEAVYSGLYHFSLDQLFKHFNKDQVLILQYEKLCLYFESEMKKVCKFLEISDYNFNNSINLPDQYRDKDFLREDLKLFYEDDVNRLFSDFQRINEFSEIDLRYWKDFCGDQK